MNFSTQALSLTLDPFQVADWIRSYLFNFRGAGEQKGHTSNLAGSDYCEMSAARDVTITSAYW